MSLRPQPVNALERGRFRVHTDQEVDRARIAALEQQVASLKQSVVRLAAKLAQIDALVEDGRVGYLSVGSSSGRSDAERR
jgi:hypothetical protein